MTKKKKLGSPGADYFKELGPMTLVMHLSSVELNRLSNLRMEIMGRGLSCKSPDYESGPLSAIDEQMRALEESKSRVLKWLEKAIQIIPWPLQDRKESFEIDVEKEWEAMKRERQEMIPK